MKEEGKEPDVSKRRENASENAVESEENVERDEIEKNKNETEGKNGEDESSSLNGLSERQKKLDWETSPEKPPATRSAEQQSFAEGMAFCDV